MSKGRKIWYLCDLWVAVQSVHHNGPKECFLSFEISSLNAKYNLVWKLVWMGLVWNI